MPRVAYTCPFFFGFPGTSAKALVPFCRGSDAFGTLHHSINVSVSSDCCIRSQLAAATSLAEAAVFFSLLRV